MDNDTLKNAVTELAARDKKTVTGLEALRLVRGLWPQVFKMQHPKPLQIGIDKALIAQNQAPDWLIKKAIRFYVNMDRYLESVREDQRRIDLNGQRTGSRVTLSQAVRADYILYYRHLKRHPLTPERYFVGKLRLVHPIERSKILKTA